MVLTCGVSELEIARAKVLDREDQVRVYRILGTRMPAEGCGDEVTQRYLL